MIEETSPAVPDEQPDDAESSAPESPDSESAAASTRSTPAAPPRRPAPAAAAASRARRIGGRVPVAARPGEARTSPDSADSTDSADSAAGADAAAEPADASAATGTDPGAPTGRTSLLKRRRTATAADDGAAASTETAAATDTPESAPKASKPPRDAPGWLRWLPAGVLAVAVVITLVFLAVDSHGVWWSKGSSSVARQQVLAAAKQCTVATNSYNYKTFAADEKKGLACTAGKQTANYKKAMESVLKPTAVKLQASQTTQINEAAIESVTANGKQWTVLLYGQFGVQNTSVAKTGRIDPFGAVVRLQKSGGKWKIVKIDSAAG